MIPREFKNCDNTQVSFICTLIKHYYKIKNSLIVILNELPKFFSSGLSNAKGRRTALSALEGGGRGKRNVKRVVSVCA